MEARRVEALAKHVVGRPSPAAGIATVNGRAELSVSARSSLYGVDEQACFLVHLSNAPPPGPPGRALPHTVTYSLSQDGVAPITEGTALLDRNGRAPIWGHLSCPGFLRCEVSWEHASGVVLTGVAAVAVDPTEIRAALPPPEDFDEFWKAQKAELAAVRFMPALTPVSSPPWIPGVECFDVRAACAGGAPVSGYLARPTGASPRSLPGLLIVHGAGVRSADLSPNGAFHGDEPYPDFWRSGTHGVEPNHNSTTEWAAEGVLTLNLNAHGVENGREAAYYEMLGASGKYDVLVGRESKDTSYFRGMCLRLIRAIDVLVEQREWDGRTVAVLGVSQGGLQAIVAAGLDERVTFFTAGVPAGCDHAAGWPKLLAGLEGDALEAAKQASRYFDCVNMATRIRVPGVMTVGYTDTACPPTSVYAAYNALQAPKRMVDDEKAGHTNTPQMGKEMMEAVRRHFEMMKQRASAGIGGVPA